MGTNYYLHNKRIKSEEDYCSDFHIGKMSCGWVFNFQAQKGKAETLAQMKKYPKNRFIYDEYGREHTYKEFWDMVEKSKEPYEDGSLPKGTTKEGRRYGDYESEGFVFSPYEFF